MFKAVKRANKNKVVFMSHRAEDIAKENGWTFTGNIDPSKGAAYTAEFEKDGDYFYGWAVENEGDFDFVFGSGQMIFDGAYVTTEENYYETIGAGI